MQEVQTALKNIGLSSKEAQVYDVLLHLGTSSVAQIAHRTHLKRPTIYIILEELRKKNLVLKIPHAKKQLFSAKDIKGFLHTIEDSVTDLKDYVPKMLTVAQQSSSARIFVYDGVAGLQESYQYKIDQLADMEFVGWHTYVTKRHRQESLDIMQENFRVLKERGISMRGFAPNHPSVKKMIKEHGKNFLNYRLLPFKEYSPEISIQVRGDFVRITSTGKLQTIIIDDENIAHALKQVFELLRMCKK